MKKLKEKLFLKEYDEEKIKIANKTARSSGASALNKDGSIRSVVGRYILDNVSKDASILDFGSGPAAVQTLALRDAGFKNVSAYDFGVNTRDGIQDPDALNKKYDVVFASNVLNVSSDEEMLRETLRDIKKAAKNEIVFNYPSSPRKSGLNAQEVKDIIIDEYGVEPELVSGTKSAPVWKVLLNSSKNISEDTVKTRDGKWTNRGDSGETHGEFRTKKQADAQRKAIYASGWKKESVEDLANRVRKNDLEWDDEIEASYAEDGDVAVQFQDRETLTHEVTPYRSRRPRVSSNTWGRIWKDGNLVYNERGPKYKVRDDVIKKLNSMNESFESDLERKLVRMWFNEKQAAWLVKHDPETAEWLAYGNIRTQDLIDVEKEINQKMGSSDKYKEGLNIDSTFGSDYHKNEDIYAKGSTWEEFIRNLEENNEVKVDSAYRYKYYAGDPIIFYKNNKSFEGEVTKYFNGDYELNKYNVHEIRFVENFTSLNSSKRDRLKYTYQNNRKYTITGLEEMFKNEGFVSVEEDPWLNYLWSVCDNIDNLQDIDYSADNCKDIIFTFGNSGNLGNRVDSLIDAFEAADLEGDVIETNGDNVIVVHFFNEYTENLDKDAVFTKDRYDDKIYYHGFMDKKDADRHYPDRLKTKTYWYSTKHGVMPGSVPRGINILDVRDIGNKSYFKTDSIISSKDLKYYDIKEDIPPMEESKRSLKKHSKLLKENAYIKTFKLGDPEFENLYKLADILTKKSPNKYIYYVGDTYFDLGQDWMWTTVLCRGNWSSYQALNPREQEEAILANSDAELEKIADSVLSDKYCPDKKRISEDAIADKIRANQDTKEMTKRAIRILKKKGAEYKDLEKEYEKIYGDKLIFDEK